MRSNEHSEQNRLYEPLLMYNGHSIVGSWQARIDPLLAAKASDGAHPHAGPEAGTQAISRLHSG